MPAAAKYKALSTPKATQVTLRKAGTSLAEEYKNKTSSTQAPHKRIAATEETRSKRPLCFGAGEDMSAKTGTHKTSNPIITESRI